MDIATAANFPAATVFRASGTAEPAVPEPAEPQADGGVVEPMAVQLDHGPFLFTQAAHPTIATHLRGD